MRARLRTNRSVARSAQYAPAVFVIIATSVLGTTATAQSSAEEDPMLQDMAVEYYAAKYRVSVEEARARVGLQDRAAGIEDRIEAVLGDEFAGIWYDHTDRGRLKIGISRAADTLSAEVLGAVRDHGVAENADLVAVRFALAELERIQESVRESLMDMILSGHARTSQNPRLNKVMVTALATLPTEEERRIAQLSAMEGVTVRRVNASTLAGRAEACNVTYCNPPLRGARLMHSTWDSCTMAFAARHRVNTDLLLLVTAGHCIWGGGPYFWAKDEAGVNHYAAENYGYVLGGVSGKDAGVVRIITGPWFPPAPLASVIVKSSSMTTYNPNYKIHQDSFSSLGQLLCMTGSATGTRCAEVSDLGADQVIEWDNVDFLLKNTGELDTCGTGYTDSGGPIYKKHKAYGIHLGSVGGPFHCYAFYQGIRGAENALNVDILLSP